MRSSNVKYIGLDVHKEAISIAVLNGAGKLVMESIIEARRALWWTPGRAACDVGRRDLGCLAI